MRKTTIYRALLAVSATAALAACGGGGGGGSPFSGPVLTAVSATLSGTSNSQVLVGVDANDNLLIQLPDGDIATFNESSALGSFIDPKLNNLEVFGLLSLQGDFVELVLTDYASLIRIDDIDSPLFSYEAYAALGDDTVSLPTGTATYTGRFIASSFVGGSIPNVEDVNDTGSDLIYGNTDITASFDSGTVDATLTFDPDAPVDFAGGVLSGTNLGISGNQYAGTIAGSTPSYSLTGTLNGGFFGPVADETAGTFSADDAGNNAEIVGGFVADKL